MFERHPALAERLRSALSVPLFASLAACGGATPHTTPPPTAEGDAEPTFTESTTLGVHGVFVAALETPVTSFGASVLDGRLYLAGGYHGEPHRYDREGQSATLVRLGNDGAWEPREPMEVALQGFALVTLGDALVRCGGSRIDNAPGDPTDMHSVWSCARYVPPTDTWEPFAELPAPRSSFDAAVLDGRIYAIGGWNIEGDQEHTTFTDEMAVYDPATGAWTTSACPVSRRALAVVATSHAIVAIGGMESGRAISAAVDVYDPSTGAWSTGPEFPSDGFGMSAAAIGDVIYASGQSGTLYAWTLGTPAWTEVRSLVQPRFFHRLVPLDGSLLAVGGIASMTTDGRVRLVESVPTTTAEGPAIGWTELTFPGRARNRFAMFAESDSLYVVGGNDSPAQHDFAPTNFVEHAFRLHVPSQRWFAVPALAEGRQSMEPVRIGEAVALVGGFGHDGTAARTFADAFVHREAGGGFEHVRGAIPTGRTQFGWGVWGDAVYLFAGLVFDGSLPDDQQFTHLRDVLRCPVVAGDSGSPFGACEPTGAELTGTRRAFASTAVGDHFYIVGGMREDFAPVEDCLDFDFTTQTFSDLPCPAHVRISSTLLEHEGSLYLVGGSARAGESLAPDRSIERFDPATRSWSVVVPELPFDTHQARWTFVEDRLVMLATQAEAGHATLAMIALP